MAESFPFYLPAEARRLYTSDAVARRIALTAHWTNTARVLELYGSSAGIALAKELGCDVTLADGDDVVCKALEGRVAAAGVSDRVKVQKLSMTAPAVPDGSQDGILLLGRLWAPLDETATKLRRFLALRGRLVMTWPVRVGLRPAKAALELWEKRVGSPLQSPRECLMSVEKHGFEPETIETPSEADLDDYYKSVEATLAKAPPESAKALKAEIEVHRDAGGKSGVTLALMVARRKEPGERPPAARDGG
ncbi:MAG: SAM-dependent methyltransferase [Myxococcaceae bacterium]|nr:SAM-dependent methyltransferase [Myxococcaceae bacterium]